MRQCVYQERIYTAYEHFRWSLGENNRRKREGKRKRYEHFHRSLREGANGRKRTQETRDQKAKRRGGWPGRMPNRTRTQQPARVETGVNWSICEITEHPENTKSTKTRKHGYHNEPSPDDCKRNELKPDIGNGGVSKSAEAANSAPRDSSTLRTIPRIRELP